MTVATHIPWALLITARSLQSGCRYFEKSTHNQDPIRAKARFLSESSLLLQTSQCTACSQCFHWAFTVFASRHSEAISLYDTFGTARTRNDPSVPVTLPARARPLRHPSQRWGGSG